MTPAHEPAAVATTRQPAGESPRPRRPFRLSVAGFLAALTLFLVAAPFVEDLRDGDLVEAALLTLVMVMAVLAVGSRRRTLALAFLLVTPAVGGKWANHFWPDHYPAVAFLVPALASLVLVGSCLLIFILRARRVGSEVLCAGVSVYLLLGLIWGLTYSLVAQLRPGAFAFNAAGAVPHALTGFESFYFSFITLTTVGYGDITPVSKVARMLTMMEAMTGTLFVGILIARLVSVYSTTQPPHEPADSSSS